MAVRSKLADVQDLAMAPLGQLGGTRMLNHESLVPDLLAAVPEFRPWYNEHLRDYGEILPYVLLDDFYRFLVGIYQQLSSGGEKAEQAKQIADRSMKLLDRAVQSTDSETRALVLSLLHNLDTRAPDYQEIKSFLLGGPNLKTAFNQYFNDYP
jgi:hypothetical protein